MSSISVRFNSFLFLLFDFQWSKAPTSVGWSVWMDSNHRPRAYQARALTTWATNRYSVLILPIFLPVCSSFILFFFYSYLWRVKSEEWRGAFKRGLKAGGDDGVRTHDPLLAGQVLSQLSYTPIRVPSGSLSFQGPFWSSKIEQQKFHTSVCANSLVISTHMTDPWKSVPVSIERRWSSRTFRYGYLVTT